jgi:hypothetical protein
MLPKNSCKEGICLPLLIRFQPVDTDELTKLLSLLSRPNSRCSNARPSTHTAHCPSDSQVWGHPAVPFLRTTVGNGVRESKPLHVAGSSVQKKRRYVPQTQSWSLAGGSLSLTELPHCTWFQQKGTVLRVPTVLCFHEKKPNSSRSDRLCCPGALFPVPRPAMFIFGRLPCLEGGDHLHRQDAPEAVADAESTFCCRHSCTHNSEGGTP